jgi:hypothetical protein
MPGRVLMDFITFDANGRWLQNIAYSEDSQWTMQTAMRVTAHK